MKLHLPKTLLVAIAAIASIVQADNVDVAAYLPAQKLYSISGNLSSDKANWEIHEGDLTLAGDNDKLGMLDENGNFITRGKVEYEGISFMGVGYYNRTEAGSISKNFEVSGTLTIGGKAKVQLGGQMKVSTTGTSQYDEYTGLIANTVIVNSAGASLDSYNARIQTLQVDAGTVNLHTNGNSKYGNTYFVANSPTGSKQVCIQQELIVNGGTVTIGHAQGSMLQTSFGKLDYSGDKWADGTLISVESASIDPSEIKQAGGTLNVQGDSVSVGGLNIEQTGGSLSISKGAYHDLADYGKSEIKQNATDADTVMNIGVIRAYNSQYNLLKDKLQENGVTVELKPSINLIQKGVGTINMGGIDFTAEIGSSPDKSAIQQSGGGIINLGGAYNGVVFDITQEGNGGTLNVNGNLSTDVVTQNGAGEIKVAEGVSLSANTLNVTSGVARSATSAVTGSNVTLSGGSLSTEGSTVTNTGSLAASELTINSGTFVNKGTLSAADAQAIAALASEEDAGLALLGASAGFTITVGPNGTFENKGQAWCDILVDGGTLTLGAGSENYEITMNSGTIDVQGDITSGSLTLNGGTINFADGATVTLADDATLNISEDTTIMVTVTPEMLENLEGMEFELFSGNASNLTSANIVFTDGDDDHSNDMSAEVTTGSSSGSIKVESSEVVPEPTTATLSLLALCGLAMRRRRK